MTGRGDPWWTVNVLVGGATFRVQAPTRALALRAAYAALGASLRGPFPDIMVTYSGYGPGAEAAPPPHADYNAHDDRDEGLGQFFDDEPTSEAK